MGIIIASLTLLLMGRGETVASITARDEMSKPRHLTPHIASICASGDKAESSHLNTSESPISLVGDFFCIQR